MKKLGLILLCALFIVGCAQQPKSENASEAISHAKTLETVEAQADYLISEANAFVNSEQFDEAIKTAKHVLANLDGDKYKQEAQAIIEEAKAELEAMAKAKAEEAKKALQEKLGGIGQ